MKVNKIWILNVILFSIVKINLGTWYFLESYMILNKCWMLNCNVCKILLQWTLNVFAISFQQSTVHNVEVTFTILHINVLRCWSNIYVLYGNLSFSYRVKILRKNLFEQSYHECLIAWDFSKCAKKFALNHIHQR